MTSKEMEERAGVPRANIRYYEAEGLLTPLREKNGYRDYRAEDLATLEKIKLLRRLGVSVEELKALRSGDAELSAVLERRLAELEAQRAMAERVAQVCADLRQEAVTFAQLDAPRYLEALETPQLSVPETDALPMVYNPLRRAAARLLDWYLTLLCLMMLLCLLGINPALVNAFAMNLCVALVMLAAEPLALMLWGTTPGKALMGMRLTGPDGKRLRYTEGFQRILMMFWYGLGAGIPIWNLVQLYRSFVRCSAEEPQPWDEEVAYHARPFGWKQLAATAAAVAVVLTASETINALSQLPPNRGDLTVAEFAENFNRQANYMGMNATRMLDETGQWVEKDMGSAAVIVFGDEWPEAEEFHYTVKDGRLTAVTLSASSENTREWISLPVGQMEAAAAAFVWAQDGVPLWGKERLNLLQTMEEQAMEGYTASLAGVTISCQVDTEGFFITDFMMIPQSEDGDNRVAFTFTMALDR